MRPRDLVMSHLRTVGEITDTGGLASAVLAEAIGYVGSSVAFAQLLSGMERSGLIEREIRGKRTYRIAPTSSAAPARDAGSAATGSATTESARGRTPAGGAAPARSAAPARGHRRGRGAATGIDYDELARRLLAEMVRREHADLARTVASLERKLASVEAGQRRLRTENALLRELLTETKASLAGQQSVTAANPGAHAPETDPYASEPGPRAEEAGPYEPGPGSYDRELGPYPGRADSGAVQLLERLLASLRGEDSPGQSA